MATGTPGKTKLRAQHLSPSGSCMHVHGLSVLAYSFFSFFPLGKQPSNHIAPAKHMTACLAADVFCETAQAPCQAHDSNHIAPAGHTPAGQTA
eukprot:9553985-Lingulodinium_polyedra.AAC.2